MRAKFVPVGGRKKIIFIVGPTAAGKSALGVGLAKKLSGEIVSCDSMQVYKGMRILSQTPARAERRGVRHHLMGIVDPREEFSVAEYIKRASGAIRSMIGGGKQPIVVGGTGLYMKALIDGLFPSPEADMAFRAKMERFGARHGKARLYEKLMRLDPEAAATIHPNDTRRVIRALEVIHSTGKTMTEMKQKTRGLKDEYDILIFGINSPRTKLYRAIDERADRMFDEGIVKEVGRLSKKRIGRTASSAIGFAEISGYLKGERSLEDAKELVKMNTRRFAKRQLCWFRADKRVKWLNAGRMTQAKIIKKIGTIWKERS